MFAEKAMVSTPPSFARNSVHLIYSICQTQTSQALSSEASPLTLCTLYSVASGGKFLSCGGLPHVPIQPLTEKKPRHSNPLGDYELINEGERKRESIRCSGTTGQGTGSKRVNR